MVVLMANRLALLSVSDKTGIVEFAQGLSPLASFLSTGGTGRILKESGVPVTKVGEYTGTPEIMQGRVKTPHPKVWWDPGIARDTQEEAGAWNRVDRFGGCESVSI